MSYNLFCLDVAQGSCFYGYTAVDDATGLMAPVKVPDGAECEAAGGTAGQCLGQTCLPADDAALYTGAVCGDGFVDEAAGEQCDCGANNCRVADPCCDGSTCQFVSGAQCSPTVDECCTPACEVVPKWHGRLCRAAVNDCDAPEYCAGGAAATCPADVQRATGLECTSDLGNAGMCFEGECVSGQDYADDVIAGIVGHDGFAVPPAYPQSNACGAQNSACATVHATYSGGCYVFNGLVWEDGYECTTASDERGACVDGTCTAVAALQAASQSECGDGLVDNAMGETCDCGSGRCGDGETCCDGTSCTALSVDGMYAPPNLSLSVDDLALANASCQASFANRRCDDVGSPNVVASVVAADDAADCAVQAQAAGVQLFQYSAPLDRCELLSATTDDVAAGCKDYIQLTPSSEAWGVYVPCPCACTTPASGSASLHVGLCRENCTATTLANAVANANCGEEEATTTPSGLPSPFQTTAFPVVTTVGSVGTTSTSAEQVTAVTRVPGANGTTGAFLTTAPPVSTAPAVTTTSTEEPVRVWTWEWPDTTTTSTTTSTTTTREETSPTTTRIVLPPADPTTTRAPPPTAPDDEGNGNGGGDGEDGFDWCRDLRICFDAASRGCDGVGYLAAAVAVAGLAGWHDPR